MREAFGVDSDLGLGLALGKKSRGYVANWRFEGHVPDGAIAMASQITGRSVGFFKTGIESKTVSEGRFLRGETIRVPLFNAEAQGGAGAINHNEVPEGFFTFERSFARVTFGTTSNLACLRATGDSMLPTIHQGDLLVIDLSDNTLQRDAVPYVLQIGETTVVKRIHRLSRAAIRIASDNPSGWSRDLQLEELDTEGIEIKGRVVAIMKLA